MTTTYSITDNDIQALVDNELDHEEAKRIRAYIDMMPDARRRYETLCRQKHLLLDWFRETQVAH